MPDFPCDYRGELLPTQKCIVCGPYKDRDIEVYQCSELERPCSIDAHGLRIKTATGNARTGPKMPVCIKCDFRTVNGVRVGALGVIEIQAVRRETERQTRTPCELQKTLAANVARARESAGLSLTATATLVGCNAGLIERIEAATHWPGPERLEQIARAMGVTPAALLT